MKNVFFRKMEERKQLKQQIAILKCQNEELAKKLCDESMSKDNKITNLLREIVSLNKANEISKQNCNELINLAKLQDENNDLLREANAKTKAEIKKLEEQNFELRLLIPDLFPVNEIMSSCSNGAWYGGNSSKAFESVDKKIKLYFEGTVYEPSYEYFTAGCCVYYLEEGMEKRKALYTIDSRNVAAYKNETVETGSVDDVKKFLLEKNIGFKPLEKDA